jgi:hypothetical protein
MNNIIFVFGPKQPRFASSGLVSVRGSRQLLGRIKKLSQKARIDR